MDPPPTPLRAGGWGALPLNGAGWFPTGNWSSLVPKELKVGQQKEKKETLLECTSSACCTLGRVGEQSLATVPWKGLLTVVRA